jgi:hypothetical protein
VVEVLGYLAGRYALARRKPDPFFRGLGRLLCDLEVGELRDLRTLVAGILHHRNKVSGPIASVSVDQAIFEANRVEQVVRVASHTEQLWIRNIPSAIRLFGLLRREGLAQDQGPAHGIRREMGDNAIRIPVASVEDIHRTIEPLPAA